MAFSGEGSGTRVDPFQITTLDQLWEVFSNLSSSFVLMNDIDASDTSSKTGDKPYNTAKGWIPAAASLTGRLDGAGFSITGMYCDLSLAGQDCGLFWKLDGVVKDVTIDWTIDSADNTEVFGGVAGSVGVNNVLNNVIASITSVGNTYHYMGGLVGNSENPINCSFCTGKINLEPLDDSSVFRVGGIIGSGEGEQNIFDSTGQLRVHTVQLTGSYMAKVGGIAGQLMRGYNSIDTNINKCRANIVINGDKNSQELGGIVGYVDSHYRNVNLTQSWAVGTITGGILLGGIGGNLRDVSIKNCWNKVNIRALHETEVSSGLIGSARFVESFSANSVISLGGMIIGYMPNNLYSADFTKDATGLFTGVLHNVDTKGDIDGDAGDKTIGNGETTANLKSESYLTSTYNSFDFIDIWQMGGIDGYPDLKNNPFDASVVVFETIINIFFNVEGEWFDMQTASLKSRLIGVDPADPLLTEAGFQWGDTSGTYINTAVVPEDETIVKNIGPYAERTEIFFRCYIIYDGKTIVSEEAYYQHFEVKQVAVDKVIVDEFISDTTGSHRIHGAVIANVNGTEYSFGSPRGNRNSPPVKGAIYKINTNDYTDFTTLVIKLADGTEIEGFNQIHYSQGFLWLSLPLTRIDPETLDYVMFNGDTHGMITNRDSFGIDEQYLYLGYGNIYKIEISQLTGSYASKYGNDIPATAIKGEYDHESQGYYLHPNSPPNWPATAKGNIHSYVSDGNYVYAEFATGSEMDEETLENEPELHKILKSDMSPAGWARIPKSTDDATQDQKYIFCGIEVQTSDTNIMGYEWGCVAVRKADMEVFALNKLHKTDLHRDSGANVQSYASTVFGNYLIDLKTNKIGYVIDISNVESWDFIDQFAPPGSWPINTKIGQYTVKAFQLYKNEDTAILETPNEITIDSVQRFHSFGWPYNLNNTVSSAFSFKINDVLFLAEPTMDTLGVTDVTETEARLSGYIINDNGKAITEVGFEFGITADPAQWTDSIVSAINTNYEALIENLTAGTVYFYRAYGVNSIGKGYGIVRSFQTPGISSVYGIEGSAVFNALPEADAKVTLINSDKDTIEAIDRTDFNGNYSFIDLDINDTYHIIIEKAPNLVAVSKPFKNPKQL